MQTFEIILLIFIVVPIVANVIVIDKINKSRRQVRANILLINDMVKKIDALLEKTDAA